MPPQPPVKDDYILNRDFTASTRLTAQHHIWHQELTYNLHPSIALPPQNAHIADIATGTAAWLLALAREHPTAQCDGFDISLAQAPPQAWLPANVSLRVWDFARDPPRELWGRYDVVHLRLVVLAVRGGDVGGLLRRLGLLLREGGWLQWDEVDVGDAVVGHAGGVWGGRVEAMEAMAARMRRHAEGVGGWVGRLPLMMGAGGFGEVQAYRVKPDWAYLKAYTDMHCLLWVEIAAHMPEEGGQREEYEELVRRVLEEVEGGAAYGAAKVVVVGRKVGGGGGGE